MFGAMAPQNQAQQIPDDDGTALKLGALMDVFAEIKPWKGEVQKGRHRTFIGALQPIEPWERDKAFPEETEYQEPDMPNGRWGEGLFEWISTVMAIRAAKNRFTAVSLGAHFGGPLVDAALALRQLNPMPFLLVGVEADPNMCAMMHEHFRENGIDSKDHWIINCAVNDTNDPVVFTVSEMRTGSNTTLHRREDRETLFNTIEAAGLSVETLRNVLMEGSTQLYVPIASMEGTPEARGELRFVSTVSVADVLGPLPFVDYLEIDIQQSEEWSLPPAREILKHKVRFLHLGTHGMALHRNMVDMFAADGWDVLVDLLPGTRFSTPDGPFTTCDGVLTAYNPTLENFTP